MLDVEYPSGPYLIFIQGWSIKLPPPIVRKGAIIINEIVLYCRYERGRRRRTSDVYRDKVIEWTLTQESKKMAVKKATMNDIRMIKIPSNQSRIFSTTNILSIRSDFPENFLQRRVSV